MYKHQCCWWNNHAKLFHRCWLCIWDNHYPMCAQRWQYDTHFAPRICPLLFLKWWVKFTSDSLRAYIWRRVSKRLSIMKCCCTTNTRLGDIPVAPIVATAALHRIEMPNWYNILHPISLIVSSYQWEWIPDETLTTADKWYIPFNLVESGHPAYTGEQEM